MYDKLKDCRGDSSVAWKLIKEIVPNQKSGGNTQEFQSNENIHVYKAEQFNFFFRKYKQDDS